MTVPHVFDAALDGHCRMCVAEELGDVALEAHVPAGAEPWALLVVDERQDTRSRLATFATEDEAKREAMRLNADHRFRVGPWRYTTTVRLVGAV